MTGYGPPMQFDTIAARVDGERGNLILNRPDHLNPLSSHTRPVTVCVSETTG